MAAMTETSTEKPARKGFFRRLLRRKVGDDKKRRSSTPPPKAIAATPNVTPEDQHKFPSRAGEHILEKPDSQIPMRESVVMKDAPSARDSAFSGPPRYDWIDIETAAAVKVQAAYRRMKVMKDLEAQGTTTAAIRNRSRRRAAQSSFDPQDMFQCCGVGLAFGNEDPETVRQVQKDDYHERKKAQAQREEELRTTFRKKHLQAKRNKPDVQEALEVVE